MYNSINRGNEMKLFRTPNFKKKLTDRVAIKKQVVNRCGLKMKNGYGWMRDPKKFVDNKVRNKYVVSPEKFVRKQLKNAVKSVQQETTKYSGETTKFEQADPKETFIALFGIVFAALVILGIVL